MVSDKMVKDAGYTCCEYQAVDELIFSKRGTLYRHCKNGIEKINVASFFERFLLRLFPLIARLLRWQFYNVVPFDGGVVVCWKKDLLIYKKGRWHKVDFDGRRFRIFRNGISRVDGYFYFGEYFDNSERGEVLLYKLNPHAEKLEVVYRFPEKSIRHVHSVKYSNFKKAFYVLTGDHGLEAKIIVFDNDFKKSKTLMEGDESCRAIYADVENEPLIYATDAQFEDNYIISFDGEQGEKLIKTDGPVFYGCNFRGGRLFSVVYEGAPSQKGNNVTLIRMDSAENFEVLLQGKKDIFSTRFFQFGQYLLPYIDGDIESVWVSSMGVKGFGSVLNEIT